VMGSAGGHSPKKVQNRSK